LSPGCHNIKRSRRIRETCKGDKGREISDLRRKSRKYGVVEVKERKKKE
jgi:hypothetical protein